MYTYAPNTIRYCPHCQQSARMMPVIDDKIGYHDKHKKAQSYFILMRCALCQEIILIQEEQQGEYRWQRKNNILYPFVSWPDIYNGYQEKLLPPHIAEDYKAAVAILKISPKASVALIQHCIQNVLREAGGAHQATLGQQMDAVMPSLRMARQKTLEQQTASPKFIHSDLKRFEKRLNYHRLIEDLNSVTQTNAEALLLTLTTLFEHYYFSAHTNTNTKPALNIAKIIVTGPFSSGKTQFIRTISEIDVVSTERKIKGDSEDTTIAMDFGRLKIDQSHLLYLFATPGCRRFDYMWEILNENILGFVMLIDSIRPETFREARHILEVFRGYAECPYVVVANKQDMPNAWSPKDLQIALHVDKNVIPCNGTDLDSVKNVILALLYEAWQWLPDDGSDISLPQAPEAPVINEAIIQENEALIRAWQQRLKIEPPKRSPF